MSIVPNFLLSQDRNDSFRAAARRKMSITSSAATMRVLSVLRHWVTKHAQDFEGNHQLKNLTIEFLEDIVCTPTLLPAEHKVYSPYYILCVHPPYYQRNTKYIVPRGYCVYFHPTTSGTQGI